MGPQEFVALQSDGTAIGLLARCCVSQLGHLGLWAAQRCCYGAMQSSVEKVLLRWILGQFEWEYELAVQRHRWGFERERVVLRLAETLLAVAEHQ